MLRKILNIILAIIIVVLIVLLFTVDKSNIEVFISGKSETKKQESLSIMLETEINSGTYSLSNSDVWPEGYIFNELLSKCKNGSKIGWDSQNNQVIVEGTSTDNCYVYFDINDTFTVTFDANGGTVSVPSKQVVYNQNYGELPTPTRAGYVFKGWNGKNLFNQEEIFMNIPNSSYTNGYYVFTSGNAYSMYYYNGIPSLNNFKENTQYTFSFISHADSENGNFRMYFEYTDGTHSSYSGDGYIYTTEDIYQSFSSQIGKTISAVKVSYGSGRTNYIKDVQFEEGNVATPYEPYYVTSDTKVTQDKNHTLKAIWEKLPNTVLIDEMKTVANGKSNGVYFLDNNGRLDFGDNSTYIALSNSNSNYKGNASIWNNTLIWACVNYNNKYIEYNLKDGYVDRTMPCTINRTVNLVINGDLSYGTNLNFETFGNYNNGGYVEFDGRSTIYNTDYIPINPDRSYVLSADFKASNTTATHYAGIQEFDADLNLITAEKIMYINNAITELAQDLDPNETVVYLNNLSNWKDDPNTPNYQLGFIIWNYKDSTGYQYPELSYSQNILFDLYTYNNINKTNNTITLKTPWQGDIIPQGTKISQSSSSSTYNYSLLNGNTLSNSWISKSATITGTISNNGSYTRFRPGTKFVKFFMMPDYNGTPNTTTYVKNVSFVETP